MIRRGQPAIIAFTILFCGQAGLASEPKFYAHDELDSSGFVDTQYTELQQGECQSECVDGTSDMQAPVGVQEWHPQQALEPSLTKSGLNRTSTGLLAPNSFSQEPIGRT